MMKEHRSGNNSRNDKTVQYERTGEVDTKPVAANVVFGAELEVRCYGILLTVSAAE